MIGAILLPFSLFLWAWTAPNLDIHWSAAAFSGIPFGMASVAVMVGTTDYLADVFDQLGWTASAIASNGILRSLFGGIFPLFAHCLSPYNQIDISSV
jgi:MFS transporter, DHA1 family, multidrug resistance protein